ncbi:Pheromone alpha factor receptor [Talaromyces pinophilus]|nr:Pheromone alpha factor receptor [Talaromyces pinophilus]
MSFDPYEQNITLTASDGSTMDIPLPFFDEYVQEGVVSCINYGCQLGATIVTFVLLCLLTRSKKRSSIIFCLNVIALLLNMFRLICEVLIYTSAWFETYAYFTGDISRVSRGDFANSVLVSVMDALLQVVMEASLVTQTKVVSTNMSRWQKATILAASLALATSSIGFRMAQMVLESMLIVKNMPFTGYIWLQKVNTILTTTSIIYFSIVLVCKLGYTIYRRKQLGVHQFSPMQIIFIMSCQTMIVPSVFSILQFSSVNIHHINNDIVTFVVVSLPVTTLWAATALPGHAAVHDAESGVPLWNKLSTSRLNSADSRKKSASTSETITFPSTVNFQGSELAKSVTIGTQMEESISP